MKTLKVLLMIALFGLISFSNYAQADDKPKAMFASYENHRNPEFRNFEKPADLAEATFMREAFELKMAELNIERINYHIEKAIKYEAPSVEISDATENLNSLMVETELQVKYVAPEN